jgi:GNAT superfamily N-acetyltransferase
VLASPFRQTPAQPSSPDTVLRNGIVDLPLGKIAAIATYLEVRAAPRDPAPAPSGRLERLGGDVARYRALYGRIGEPWLWFTRAVLRDDALKAVIGHRDVDASVLVHDGEDVALVELDFRKPGECELVFFGLVPERCGQGIGRPLLADALRRAFARRVSRVWLHTCTLDHPAALPFYVRAGFTPYRRAVEIADDPRLGGYLPRTAAAGFPIL